jgi:hypothetical protein
MVMTVAEKVLIAGGVTNLTYAVLLGYASWPTSRRPLPSISRTKAGLASAS